MRLNTIHESLSDIKGLRGTDVPLDILLDAMEDGGADNATMVEVINIIMGPFIEWAEQATKTAHLLYDQDMMSYSAASYIWEYLKKDIKDIADLAVEGPHTLEEMMRFMVYRHTSSIDWEFRVMEHDHNDEAILFLKSISKRLGELKDTMHRVAVRYVKVRHGL
jgi:hypothetical protein